tara:strand:- start:291 stop:419 length:129 start_codon:yes stop_codon:yes gene_type:complete
MHEPPSQYQENKQTDVVVATYYSKEMKENIVLRNYNNRYLMG